MTEEALTRLGDIAYVEQTFDSCTRLQEAWIHMENNY